MYPYLTPAELSSLDGHDDPLVRHAAEDIRQMAQELLLARIEDQGRKVLGSPTDSELSYRLWPALKNPKRISDTDAADLQRLVDVAGGWWLITEGEMPRFVELPAWEEHYRDFQEV